jgi:hypothetical protein
MRWLGVWLVLTGVFFAGQLVAPFFSSEAWEYTREDLAHLAAIPLVQLAAIWIVVLVRRHNRETVKGPPPPALEKSASRPDAEP